MTCGEHMQRAVQSSNSTLIFGWLGGPCQLSTGTVGSLRRRWKKVRRMPPPFRTSCWCARDSFASSEQASTRAAV